MQRGGASIQKSKQGRLMERLGGVIIPLSAWVILIITFTIANPIFFTSVNFINIMRQSSVMLVVALAGTFAILMGSIDLSVAAVLTMGSIVVAKSVSAFGDWGIIIALAVCLLCGIFNGVVHAYGKLPSFLVTLGSLFLIQGIGLIVCKGRPQSWNSDLITGLMGGTIYNIPVIALWALGILVVCTFIASRTRFGRYLIAIGDGENTARMSGIPVAWIRVCAFSLSGLLSGIAGIMLAVRMASGAPGMGDPYLLDSIAAIVLGGTALSGGVGGPSRTIFGVLVIVTLANGMTILQVDPFYQVAIRGAVVIAAVALTMRRGELGIVK